MRFFKTGVWVVALAIGLVAGLTALPAMADDNDDLQLKGSQTALDSAIINGLTADLEGETGVGRLFVGYTRTNGTRTTAADQSTQDTEYESDTVIGVPAANMMIRRIDDGDSNHREMSIGSYAGIFTGYTGETYPHPLPPESGETIPSIDSVPTVVLELRDTGVVQVSVVNTSNYPCTFFVILHIPDTDYNAGYDGGPAKSTYREENDAQIGKFITSITDNGDTLDVLTANRWGELTTAASVPAETRVFVLDNVTLAEDAETFFNVRIATAEGAVARDSLSITVMLFPDSGLGWSQNTRFTRILNGAGYRGMNDTVYAEGSSADSVSMWVYVATAIVRVEKIDTIWAPVDYIMAVGNDVNRQNDTVPGAVIVYTINYDNDGNRRADDLEIIDYLPNNVDLYINPYFNGTDTPPYANTAIGVDTRMVHSRYASSGTNNDTCLQIFYSNRNADSENFVRQLLPFSPTGQALSDSIIDTVAAIRLVWTSDVDNFCSLTRDQYDEPTAPSAASLDPLHNIDGGQVVAAGTSDSGDIGRVIFAVVIR